MTYTRLTPKFWCPELLLEFHYTSLIDWIINHLAQSL